MVRGWPRPADDQEQGANPWAAMPSDHFGSAAMVARLAWSADPRVGAAAGAYAGVLAMALVYLGEHYVTDGLAGGAPAVGVDAALSRSGLTQLPG